MIDRIMNHENLMTIFDDKNKELKLSAINNNVRYAILEILRNHQIKAKRPQYLYSREINTELLEKYYINITPQMLGQHLKQLTDANIIDEKTIKKEVPNKIGKRSVNGYCIKSDAFGELFLEVNFMNDELLTLHNLLNLNEGYKDGKNCILTVLNGKDKGKSYKINNDESVFIGRKSLHNKNNLSSFAILLDNSYKKVSSIDKPHIKIYHKNNQWYVLDKNSKGRTYINDKLLEHEIPTRIKKNSFIKLSKGTGCAIIYCSY